MTAADNPYSPPKSEVRDAGPVRVLAERPRQVVYATALLTISLVLSLPGIHLQFRRTSATWALEVAAVGFLLVYAAVLIVAMWRGRNWARMLYAIGTLLSIVSLPFADATDSVLDGVPSVTERALDIVTWVLDVPIFALLFTRPGSLWFKYTRARRV